MLKTSWPETMVKTDEGRATTPTTTTHRRVSFMAMPITTTGQKTSLPNAAEADISKVYEIFTTAGVLDKVFKEQGTDMDDEEENSEIATINVATSTAMLNTSRQKPTTAAGKCRC